jgi:NACHT domain
MVHPSRLLSTLHRTVILGNPGGGKSTFAQKVTFELAKHYQQRKVGARQLTPSLVILRDYAASRKERKISIREYLELCSSSDYQLPPATGAFEYLLRNGRLLVIFDGLDELLDTQHRQRITQDIEAFCSLYPNIPVLVTSREIGYGEAPLDPDLFDIAKIASFERSQIKEYVSKWFATDEELSEADRNKKAVAFLKESNAVPDLCANPLMLALLCNIYRGENYIPKNRPDVYEKCALMLFEKWDKSRNINVQIPFEAHVPHTIKFLAHWIYTNDRLQAGVTEPELIKSATKYLMERRFEDADEAAFAAGKFIEFCRGRAWVFTDTGTKKTGERIYQFTHRTFLEYFAAGHLIRICSTPEALGKLLIPRISHQEWDVVAQLALQLQNKNVEDAAEKFLTQVMDQCASGAALEQYSLLSFGLRSLEFLVPRPEITRRLAEMAFTFYLRRPFQDIKRSTQLRPESRERALITLFQGAAAENRSPLSLTTETRLTKEIADDDDEVATRALELLRHSLAQRAGLDDDDQSVNSEAIRYWRTVREKVLTKGLERRRLLARKCFRIAFDEFLDGGINAHEFIEWHGPGALWKMCGFDVWKDRKTLPVAHLILAEEGSQRRGWFVKHGRAPILAEIGQILIATPMPWVHAGSGVGGPFRLHDFLTPEKKTGSSESMTPLEVAGALFLIAPFLELARSDPRAQDVDMNVRGLDTVAMLGGRLTALIPLVKCYFEPVTPQEFKRLTRKFSLPEQAEEILRGSIEGTLSVVAIKKSKRLQ